MLAFAAEGFAGSWYLCGCRHTLRGGTSRGQLKKSFGRPQTKIVSKCISTGMGPKRTARRTVLAVQS